MVFCFQTSWQIDLLHMISLYIINLVSLPAGAMWTVSIHGAGDRTMVDLLPMDSCIITKNINNAKIK